MTDLNTVASGVEVAKDADVLVEIAEDGTEVVKAIRNIPRSKSGLIITVSAVGVVAVVVGGNILISKLKRKKNPEAPEEAGETIPEQQEIDVEE